MPKTKLNALNLTLEMNFLIKKEEKFSRCQHTANFRRNYIFQNVPKSLCGTVVNVQNCDFVQSEFELQSRCHVHFQTNTLRKGLDTLISTARVK